MTGDRTTRINNANSQTLMMWADCDGMSSSIISNKSPSPLDGADGLSGNRRRGKSGS
jgi:hypothetical protein